jgi:excisionase family DNA binding protein
MGVQRMTTNSNATENCDNCGASLTLNRRETRFTTVGTFFENLVTKRDLARMLCVSEGLINKLVGERGMPHIKLGRTIRFSVSEVKNWMMQKGIKQ